MIMGRKMNYTREHTAEE